MQTQKTSSFSGIVLFCSYLPETQNFYATAGGKRKKKKEKQNDGVHYIPAFAYQQSICKNA